MKRLLLTFLCILLFLGGCMQDETNTPSAVAESGYITVKDSDLHDVKVIAFPQTVVALSASIGEIWLLAGGDLKGVTSDAVNERMLNLKKDTAIIGTVKDPSAETILSLQPDLVLLSQDIGSHAAIAEILEQADIPYYTAKVQTPEDYFAALENFTKITGDGECFNSNGIRVKNEIESLLKKLSEHEQEHEITALFLRAYSSGVKAKAYDHTVCTILNDIGVKNIAEKEGFALEDVSIEAIVQADPDYILVVPMGDEDKAVASLEASLVSNPAFAGLSAVKEGNFIMLSKDLYHYKPNNRWGEAYETLLKIFYPQIFFAS